MQGLLHHILHAVLTLKNKIYTLSTFTITEAISRAWRGQLTFVSEVFHDFHQDINTPLYVEWISVDAETRGWSGILIGVEYQQLSAHQHQYRCEVGSALILLKYHHIDYASYCDQDTRRIVKQVFEQAKLWSLVQDWQLCTRLPLHAMAVQLHESSYDFMARRCSVDNIIWYTRTHAQQEYITFWDHPDCMSTFPLFASSIKAVKRYDLCLGLNTFMSPVSDWEDLPVDRLYRGIPSVGAGIDVPGVRIHDDVPLGYDLSVLQAGLMSRHLTSDQAFISYESLDITGTDPSMNLMVVLTHERQHYRVNHIIHRGDALGNRLYYRHEAILVPMHHPWRSPCPAYPQGPSLLDGIVESHSDKPAIDEEGRIYVKISDDKQNLSPCTGSKPIPYLGRSFPLQPGSSVLVGFLHHDPTMPIVLGNLYKSQQEYSLDTRTPAQQALVFCEDNSGTAIHLGPAHWGLDLKSGQQSFINITCIGGMIAQCTGELRISSLERGFYTCDQHIILESEGLLGLTSAQGSLALDTAKTLQLNTEGHIRMKTGTQLTLQAQHTIQYQFKQGLHMQASSDMLINLAGVSYLQSYGDIGLHTERHTITLSARKSGAAFILNDQGMISIQAKKLRISCDNLIFTGSVNMGGLHSLSVLSLPLAWLPDKPAIQSLPHQFTPTITLVYPDKSLTVAYKRHSLDYQLGNEPRIKLYPKDATHRLKPLNIGQSMKLTLWSTEQTQIICQISGKPISRIVIEPVDIMNHACVILCLPAPVIVNLRQDRTAYDSATRNILTQDEIDYFQHQGGNVTLFIHGFNVPLGSYGTPRRMKQWLRRHLYTHHMKDVDVTSEHVPFTVRHEYDELVDSADLTRLLKYSQRHGSVVTHPLCEAFYDTGAGTGAHSWFVNMEYNMNAHMGFKGDYRDPRYTRIIGIAWSGDVPLPYYMAAEHGADLAAARMIHLIRQLVEHKIHIHMVAHSLGNRVLLMLLHALASDPAYQDCIDTVFMWQAAVPDLAIIDMKGLDSSIKQNWKTYLAIHAVKHLYILYSRSDIATLGFSYEAATKVGVSPACMVARASYCPPDDNQAMLIHKGPKKVLSARIQVRPPLGLRGLEQVDKEFMAIVQGFKEKYAHKLTCVDYSPISIGHSYMKVWGQIGSADIYAAVFTKSTYTLGNHSQSLTPEIRR